MQYPLTDLEGDDARVRKRVKEINPDHGLILDRSPEERRAPENDHHSRTQLT